MPPHDFKKFPELTNNQMNIYYFASPHKQITEDFKCKVVKITDGDTIRVKWEERDFDFPIRFLKINSPELNEKGGLRSRDWLVKQILNKEVDVVIDPQKRVERWGRLLGEIFFGGRSINLQSIDEGFSVPFGEPISGNIPNINSLLEVKL